MTIIPAPANFADHTDDMHSIAVPSGDFGGWIGTGRVFVGDRHELTKAAMAALVREFGPKIRVGTMGPSCGGWGWEVRYDHTTGLYEVYVKCVCVVSNLT